MELNALKYYNNFCRTLGDLNGLKINLEWTQDYVRAYGVNYD